MRALALSLPLLLLAACDDSSSPGSGGSPARVVITELMYHPVGEQTAQEEHEFLELHNPGARAVDLGGWRLTGGIRFGFPPGTSIPAGGYLVVAKHRPALLALAHYGLTDAQVVGDYDGELDNDGERVVLEDADRRLVDEVIYDDRFPWPVGADGLGAGERWLSPDKLGNQGLDAHRFLGRSLERLSVTQPGTLVENWAASPLDGATPGRANSQTADQLAAVTAIEVAGPTPGPANIRPGDEVRVRARIAGRFVIDREIEYFVDDLERTDEPRARVPLSAASDGSFTATLPAQKVNAIVRYRVKGDRGQGPEVLSPQAGDPDDWHAYFVSPDVPGKTPAYHLFISKGNWELMWDFIEQGRVPGHVGTLGGRPGYCTPNLYWNERVPAVLVVEGKVHDVQTRYQGSSVNRTGGPRNIDLRAWPMTVPPPARPAPFRPLSWRVAFPRHNRLDRKSAFNLNKLNDGSCLGFSYGVAVTLFEQAGLPAGEPPTYVRLYVNGAYYHYAQRMERVDEELLRRFYGNDHPMGDLFKSTGIRWEQGPFDWGDERPLGAACGYSAEQRYATTYERQSLEDRKQGSPEVQKLIEDLHAARAAGLPAMRKFIEDNFDVPLLSTYMALRNWMAPWDDYFHNHYLYRRTDGRWQLIPNDFDGEMLNTGFSVVESSFFHGRENDRSNRNNWFNYIKDTYLQAFRPEFVARLEQLSQTVLHPGNVEAIIDEVAARYDIAEAKASPIAVMSPMLPMCSLGDAPMVAARMKSFARRRHERLLDGLLD